MIQIAYGTNYTGEFILISSCAVAFIDRTWYSGKTYFQVHRDIIIGGVYERLIQVNQEDKFPAFKKSFLICTAKAFGLLEHKTETQKIGCLFKCIAFTNSDIMTYCYQDIVSLPIWFVWIYTGHTDI